MRSRRDPAVGGRARGSSLIAPAALMPYPAHGVDPHHQRSAR